MRRAAPYVPTPSASGKKRQFNGDFRQQIGKNGEKSKQERLDYLEEGKRVRQKLEEDRLKLEAIKQKKLAQI